jgi:hypothetical protein
MAAQPDPMTPAWSRALAQVGSSSYWGDWSDWATKERRDMFLEQASQYATFDDLPGDLKAIFQAAERAMRSKRAQ